VKVIKKALSELYSMFVDDPLLVTLVLAWIAIGYIGRHAVPTNIAGPILFAGLAILLALSTLRQASRIARRRKVGQK
jgi:hypothetical protein